MAVQIELVRGGSSLRRFINLPFELYAHSPYWIPPLIQDEKNTLRRSKNPAFEYCDAAYAVAYKGGKPVGRVAAILNRRFIEKWGKPYCRFGWIDFVDDPEVSKALLDWVEAWAREHHLTGVHGPMGFTDLDREGMLIEGFDELGTLPMIYNYPYYPAHLEALGYRKDVDWIEFEIKTPKEIPEKVLRIQEIVLKRSGLRLVPARSSRDLRPYARAVFQVLNEAYADLYGVVELTERQIDAYIKQYFGFIRPDYAKVIVDRDGEVAAFGIGMPSFSVALQRSRGRLLPFGFLHLLRAMNRPTKLDMYLVAVRPKYQNLGVNSILMTEITRAGIKNGIISAESSGELETNKAVQDIWKYYETRQHKRRRCYLKLLE
ncbi:MAG TPA: GNAT family N-acetyltransferase [Spirochaetia bacterium]|nr:GNAT family N-acetyltransferase [Spirochaetia bacterium]